MRPSTPGRARPSVAPDPLPRISEDSRVTDEVVEVIEPTIGIVGSPLVQLGLDLQYPRPGLIGVGHGASVFTGDLLTFQSLYCELAVPLRHVAGFPDLGLLRGLRPTPSHQLTTGLPVAGLAGRRGGRPGMVPTFTTDRSTGCGAQLFPCSLAMGTPQAFPMAS